MLLQVWLTATDLSKSDIKAVAALLMPAGRKERQYALRVKNQFGVYHPLTVISVPAFSIY